MVKNEGYDCCAGLREDREGEGHMRNFLSHAFYKIIGRLCRLDMTDGAGDFRMMNRTMADSILELKEYNRYMKGIFSFVGFDTKWIPFHNVERAAGETKWTFRSLFRYALDGILSFSSAPATLAGTAGFFLIAAAFIIGIATLLIRHSLPGLTLVICLLFFLSGIQMFFIAILGQYIARDYICLLYTSDAAYVPCLYQ